MLLAPRTNWLAPCKNPEQQQRHAAVRGRSGATAEGLITHFGWEKHHIRQQSAYTWRKMLLTSRNNQLAPCKNPKQQHRHAAVRGRSVATAEGLATHFGWEKEAARLWSASKSPKISPAPRKTSACSKKNFWDPFFSMPTPGIELRTCRFNSQSFEASLYH